MPGLGRAFAIALVVLAGSAPAFAQESVYLEELTWTEVRDGIKAGKTTVIFPTGGTEQNGAHMVLGKHDMIVHYVAGEIAKRLGNALVAPVLGYVPQGSIDPPFGGMRFAGTITLPEEYFMKVAEWAARSFKAHGFTDIVLIGDSTGNLPALKAVAEQLNKEWAASSTSVHHLVPDEFYMRFNTYLFSQGVKNEDIGSHAGVRDTSNLMAIEDMQDRKGQLIRWDKIAPNGGYEGSGVNGNPTRASVAHGRKGLEFKIAAWAEQIRGLTANKRQP